MPSPAGRSKKERGVPGSAFWPWKWIERWGDTDQFSLNLESPSCASAKSYIRKPYSLPARSNIQQREEILQTARLGQVANPGKMSIPPINGSSRSRAKSIRKRQTVTNTTPPVVSLRRPRRKAIWKPAVTAPGKAARNRRMPTMEAQFKLALTTAAKTNQNQRSSFTIS